METFLYSGTSNAAREIFIQYLSLNDLLNLRLVFKDFDMSFSIIDSSGKLHLFESLTQKNIETYNNIVNELNQELVKASINGQIETVKALLLRREIDVNAICKGERTYPFPTTALTAAAWRGHKNIVEELLLRSDIDINAMNIFAHTALSEAKRAGNLDIVKILEEDSRIKKIIFYG